MRMHPKGNGLQIFPCVELILRCPCNFVVCKRPSNSFVMLILCKHRQDLNGANLFRIKPNCGGVSTVLHEPLGHNA